MQIEIQNLTQSKAVIMGSRKKGNLKFEKNTANVILGPENLSFHFCGIFIHFLACVQKRLNIVFSSAV